MSYECCTTCIVGVARETSAITSDSTVEHLADSFQGLPDAHAIVKLTLPKHWQVQAPTPPHTDL